MSDPRHPRPANDPHVTPVAAAIRQPPRRLWLDYLLAVATTVLATLLTFALQSVIGAEQVRIPFAFFYAAVLVTTLYGGRLPGLFCVLLSALASAYFFIPPFHSFRLGLQDILQVLVFVLIALLIIYLTLRSKRAERAAQKGEEWLMTILKSIGDAVIATDAAGRLTFMNGVAQSLTGWSEQEARGRDLHEVFRIINEETRGEVENPVTRVLQEGGVVGLANHTLLLAKDGREIPIDDSGAPITDRRGHIIGVVLVFHDISRRRQDEAALTSSEQRYRELFENANDIIYTADLDGNLTSLNKAGERIIGYSRDEVLGKPITTWVAPEFLDRMQEMLARKLQGAELTSYELEIYNREGEKVTLEVSSRLTSERGKPAGIQGIARDISERKRAEAEREELLAREQDARAAAERLANRMSYLQTVTAALSGAVTPSQVATAIVEHGVGSLGAYAGVVALLDESGAELHLVGTSGFSRDHVDKWKHFPVSTPVAIAEAVRTKAPVLLESPEEWQRLFPAKGPLADVSHTQSLACIPLTVDGRVLGSIGLSFSEPRRFTDEDTGLMLALARQCTQALERARLYEAERRARAAAEESEERYRALADSMPQIVWTARPDGYFDYYNKRWFEYTGMTMEQTRGWGWQPALHPEDVEHCLRRWATAVQNSEGYEIAYRFRRASDGSYRWHLGRAVPMRDAQGQIIKWFGTATDIHDQKQAEAALRFLAEASALLASSLDYETTLMRMAKLSVEALADYCLIDVLDDDGLVRRVATAHIDPEKDALGAELRRFPPDMNRGEGVAQVLRTGKPLIVPAISEDKLRAMVRDEEHLQTLRRLGLRSFMTVPLAARGRTIGAITFALTTSERNYNRSDLQFAEELARRASVAIENARLYSRAQEVNRVKDEFLATLSHELRTPLTPIIGWTQLMSSGGLPQEDMSRGLNVIDRNSQALTRLINDLLDMSSILSGKMRIERVPIALDAAVREAVETVRPMAEQRNITLDYHACDGDAPAIVSGDRTRLVQVFWNLLNNAVKFSGEESRVRVSCHRTASEVQITVADEGAGIAPEFIPHVFERFRQADGSTTRRHGGLGIGLSLVKSFVEAHGGTTSAESDGEGLGSRFTVRLPLLRDEAEPEAGDDAQDEELETCTDNVCHVLLIEDAPDTLDLLRVVFESRGYRTTPCASAEEALRIVQTVWFDIIVSDIGLPHIDGYELIRQLRRIPHLREVPAVALTGYAATKDAESALAAGFDTHIPKPVDPAALAHEIEQLLQQKTRRGVPEK